MGAQGGTAACQPSGLPELLHCAAGRGYLRLRLERHQRVVATLARPLSLGVRGEVVPRIRALWADWRKTGSAQMSVVTG